MRIHYTKSPLAGQTVLIKKTAVHHLYSNFGGSELVVTDWADRFYKRSVYSWSYPPIEVLVYCARWARYLAGYVTVSQQDELLVGTIMGNRMLVHISELDIPLE